jgi:phenylacetate-CoA ligase
MAMKQIIPIYMQQTIETVMYKCEIREAKLAKELLEKSFHFSDVKCAADYQHRKLAIFFSTIKEEIPYYAELLVHSNTKSISDLKNLPFLDKSIIRKNFSRMISRKKNIFNSFHFNTGGSTGEPLQFYASRLCGLMDRYHQMFLFELSGYKGGQKIVAFDGVVIPAKQRTKGIFWQLKSKRELPYGSYHFSSHSFSKNTENQYISKFMKLKPSYLRGYPSFISLFSEAISRKSIEPSFVRGIHLTAENIYQYQIESIAHVFKCPIYRQYGHSEMAVFGFCLPQSEDYFCSPYYGITEIVNENGQQVGVGESGEIVVTGFHNYIMPLVRYRTGDHAEYGGCFNGFTVLKKITGRTQDFLIDKYGTRVPVTGLVFGQHFHAFGKISKWQLIQEERGKIEVLIVRSETYSKKDEQEILTKLSEGGRFVAKIRYVDEINLTQRGKMTFVVNRLINQ